MATDSPPWFAGQNIRLMGLIATDRPPWLTGFPKTPIIVTTFANNTSGRGICVMGILVAIKGVPVANPKSLRIG
jgi:hypothetical protein